MNYDRDNMRQLITVQGRLASFLGLLTLIPYPVYSQMVRGAVIVADSRAPIAGATVQLLGDGGRDAHSAISDSLGLFVLPLPRAGTYTVLARRLGFLTSEPDTLHVGRGESVSIEIRLGSTAVPLDPMVVTVRGDEWTTGFARRKAGGFGRFLSRADIESRAPSRTTDLFRTVPGLSLAAQRRGPGYVLQMRGLTGPCLPAVWVDGLYVALSPTGTTLDDLLAPQLIEAVEIYNSVSSAPSQYQSGTCGVVLFWTRRWSHEEGERVRWKKVLIGAGAAALFMFLIR